METLQIDWKKHYNANSIKYISVEGLTRIIMNTNLNNALSVLESKKTSKHITALRDEAVQSLGYKTVAPHKVQNAWGSSVGYDKVVRLAFDKEILEYVTTNFETLKAQIESEVA